MDRIEVSSSVAGEKNTKDPCGLKSPAERSRRKPYWISKHARVGKETSTCWKTNSPATGSRRFPTSSSLATTVACLTTLRCTHMGRCPEIAGGKPEGPEALGLASPRDHRRRKGEEGQKAGGALQELGRPGATGAGYRRARCATARAKTAIDGGWTVRRKTA